MMYIVTFFKVDKTFSIRNLSEIKYEIMSADVLTLQCKRYLDILNFAEYIVHECSKIL